MNVSVVIPTRVECGLWKHKKTCLHAAGNVVVVQTVDNTKVLNALTGLKEKLNRTEAMLGEQAEDNRILKEKLNDQTEQLSNLKSGVLTAVAEPKVINNQYIIEREVWRCYSYTGFREDINDMLGGCELCTGEW